MEDKIKELEKRIGILEKLIKFIPHSLINEIEKITGKKI